MNKEVDSLNDNEMHKEDDNAEEIQCAKRPKMSQNDADINKEDSGSSLRESIESVVTAEDKISVLENVLDGGSDLHVNKDMEVMGKSKMDKEVDSLNYNEMHKEDGNAEVIQCAKRPKMTLNDADINKEDSGSSLRESIESVVPAEDKISLLENVLDGGSDLHVNKDIAMMGKSTEDESQSDATIPNEVCTENELPGVVSADSCHVEEVHDELIKNVSIVELPELKEEPEKESVGALVADECLKNVADECLKDVASEDAVDRAFVGKKLLVLDVNGLLLDICPYVPYDCDPDDIINKKAVFKRPYCDDFLNFCFENFNVGVWTSRTKWNIDPIIEFLLGNDKNKLLFCWDQSQCTRTGFSNIEKRSKPILLKKIKKLWEKCEPEVPWSRGAYNETNTLLIDDSPSKALANPLYNAVFPRTYNFKKIGDTSLGPGGDIRVYLEGLATAGNVQEYVRQNPFGQRAITETNLSWGYYLKVLKASSTPPREN